MGHLGTLEWGNTGTALWELLEARNKSRNSQVLMTENQVVLALCCFLCLAPNLSGEPFSSCLLSRCLINRFSNTPVDKYVYPKPYAYITSSLLRNPSPSVPFFISLKSRYLSTNSLHNDECLRYIVVHGVLFVRSRCSTRARGDHRIPPGPRGGTE